MCRELLKNALWMWLLWESRGWVMTWWHDYYFFFQGWEVYAPCDSMSFSSAFLDSVLGGWRTEMQKGDRRGGMEGRWTFQSRGKTSFCLRFSYITMRTAAWGCLGKKNNLWGQCVRSITESLHLHLNMNILCSPPAKEMTVCHVLIKNQQGLSINTATLIQFSWIRLFILKHLISGKLQSLRCAA